MLPGFCIPMAAESILGPWNPADISGSAVFSAGNSILSNGGIGQAFARGRVGHLRNTGKYYFECTITGVTNGFIAMGVSNGSVYAGGFGNITGLFAEIPTSFNWRTIVEGSVVDTVSVSSPAEGDVIGFYFDSDEAGGTLGVGFSINGTWIGGGGFPTTDAADSALYHRITTEAGPFYPAGHISNTTDTSTILLSTALIPPPGGAVSWD